MPDGVMRWFDEATGEGVVVRRGRSYRAPAAEVDPDARRPGVRVHFDAHERGGVLVASDVSLREGTRVSRRQGRFGSLTGSRRPDSKGPAPSAALNPERASAYAEHPIELVRRWATDLASGEVEAATALYAPDATVAVAQRRVSGRRAIRALLDEQPVAGSGRAVRVRGAANGFEVVFEGRGPEEAAWAAYSELDHGQIREQRIESPPAPAGAEPPEGLPFPIEVVVRGRVEREAVDYARRRIAALSDLRGEPVLFARLKLSQMPDPARTRPSLCEVELDLNGSLVRSHGAARSMHEVVDLVQQRLRSAAERRNRARTASARTAPGEWHHGDLPTARPEYFPRPLEERELVRHKTLAPDEVTLDEAIFDMDQLDYDFYLFRDLASGRDSLLERLATGAFQLRQLDGVDTLASPTAADVLPSTLPAPTLAVAAALEQLELENGRWFFFRHAGTGAAAVVYRRYDGHYGMITCSEQTAAGAPGGAAGEDSIVAAEPAEDEVALPAPPPAPGDVLEPEELEDRLEGISEPAEELALHEEDLVSEAMLDEGTPIEEVPEDLLEEELDELSEPPSPAAARSLPHVQPRRLMTVDGPHASGAAGSEAVDVDELRARLLAERSRLEALEAEFDREGLRERSEREDLAELASFDQHPAEQGTETFDRERDVSIRDQVEGELALVEQALRRIEQGTYGRCEACGAPIGRERLEAEPSARFCLADQLEAEREMLGRRV